MINSACAIAVFVIAITLPLLLNVSKVLLFLFPIGALAVGVFLYSSFPVYYIAFNWWIWLLSPFVSRMVEQQNGLGQDAFKSIILTPYIVTSLCAICLFRRGKFFRKDDLPYMIAIAALIYSLLIGILMRYPMMQIIPHFLRWFPAVCLGMFFSRNWRHYPQFSAITQKTFLWGTLVMALYGIFQYIYVPLWDVVWWNNSPNLQSSIGWPEPYQLRIWSTLNTPMVFSVTMISGLAISLSRRTVLSYLVFVVGLIALLLSDVRTAWLGFAGGLLVLFWVSGIYMKSRIISSVFFAVTASVVMIAATPLLQATITRFATFNDIQNDGSLLVRQQLYLNYFDQAISNFVGDGLGANGLVDAGLLEPLTILGWAGFIPFLMSTMLIFYALLQCFRPGNDDFSKAAAVSVLGISFTITSNNMFTLFPGVLFWGLSSLAIAGFKYNHALRFNSDVLERSL
jgi:hypothetical protein